ncbi:type II secretion system F family protein [Geobacter sp. AOG1]|uniref:type II secretion system F family protein n=1 Tax=Geobacter sp. AOG1 TaxID=1566346 RepID=UPI001CC5825B|nr:type II secretion system F family protein [Geobacter sp. AOG1]GFE58407.1 secretion protein [Geobacter sp. AOG1]
MQLIILFTFLAVFSILAAVFLGTAEYRQSSKFDLKRRLRRMAKERKAESMSEGLRSEILKEVSPFDKFLARIPYLNDLDKRLDHAGLKISTSRFLLTVIAIVVFGFLFCYLITKMFWFSLLFVLLLFAAPPIYLELLKQKRIETFTELFPEALTMIARSLRAGHSFTSAIQLIGQEIADPVGELFKTAYDQQQLGLRITDTLDNMNERMDSLDLRFFTTAIGINIEVGGNLAEILDNLSHTIRERLRIRRQIQVYTAQGRLSGYVLAALPLVTFVIFQFLIPSYERVMLTEEMGRYALILAVFMQVIGFLFIRKIINIRI